MRGRAPGPPGDLRRAGRVDAHVEDRRGALHDRHQVIDGVELEPGDQAEAVPQRSGDQAGSGSGADQGEGRQVQRNGAGRGALAQHDVDAEILHGRIQHLFHWPGQAVDLVDEQHVAGLELGEHGREVPGPLHCRARGGLEVGLEFVGDNVSQGGLAEAGRSGKQQVVDWFAALASGTEQHVEMPLELSLANEVTQGAGPESRFAKPIDGLRIGRQQICGLGLRPAAAGRGSIIGVSGQRLGAGHAQRPYVLGAI